MGKKGKEVNTADTFVPMGMNSNSWPGKISDPDLFAHFAELTRAQLSAISASPLVALRISQLGLKNFTDFLIIVRKDISIYRLQLEICKSQFDSSVSPSDIVIFKTKVDNAFEKIERRIKRNNGGVSSTPSNYTNDAETINHLIGISPEYICIEPERSLLSYFPDIKTFRLPSDINKECTVPLFLRDIMTGKEAAIIASKRTKRYNDTYAEDKAELALVKAAANPSAKIKEFDYPMPTFSIFFDVKEYCKIKTFKSNFEQLLKQDKYWMMKPTDLDAPREQLFTAVEPDYVHSPILLYEFGKIEKDLRKRYLPASVNGVATEEDIDKRKGGISLKTIAFLKNKTKEKKTGADKRIIKRPPNIAPKPVPRRESAGSLDALDKNGTTVANSSMVLTGRLSVLSVVAAPPTVAPPPAAAPPAIDVTAVNSNLPSVTTEAFSPSRRGSLSNGLAQRMSRVSQTKRPPENLLAVTE